jgi:hypothetical protein
MRSLQPILAVVALLSMAACGDSIGDPCSLSSECSSQGDRFCDVNSPGGYCTVFGCDHDTCPGEAVCVRFFSVAETNLPCDAQTEDIGGSGSTDDCTADELCTLSGSCVPRTAESRFCMLKCGGSGDCREDYECRDEGLMQEHGGEPVAIPGQPLGDDLQAFCAPAPL